MRLPPISCAASIHTAATPFLRPAVFVSLLGVGVCGFALTVRAEPDLAGRYRGRGEGLVTLTVAPPTRDKDGEGYAITVADAARPRGAGGARRRA